MNNTNMGNYYDNFNQFKQIKKGFTDIMPIIIVFVVGFFCCSIFFFASSINKNSVYLPGNTEKNALSNISIDSQMAEMVDYSNNLGNYVTNVKYDNFYKDQKIKNNEEARDLIVKDSVEQKSINYNKEIAEIENKIMTDYKIMAMNLEGIDIEVARELEKVVGFVYNKYPKARDYLTNITLTNADDNYIAVFMGMSPFADTVSHDRVNKTLIGLNSKYFLNKEKLMNTTVQSAAIGHFPKNAKGVSTIAHEFGHFLSFLVSLDKNDVDNILLVKNKDYQKVFNLADDRNNGDTSLAIIEEAYASYKSKYGEEKTLLEFREGISGYAIAKDSNGNYLYDETIAEAFHDYYLNGENAAFASKEIIEVLEKKINQL